MAIDKSLMPVLWYIMIFFLFFLLFLIYDEYLFQQKQFLIYEGE
jgi:hypothetical protein